MISLNINLEPKERKYFIEKRENNKLGMSKKDTFRAICACSAKTSGYILKNNEKQINELIEQLKNENALNFEHFLIVIY